MSSKVCRKNAENLLKVKKKNLKPKALNVLKKIEIVKKEMELEKEKCLPNIKVEKSEIQQKKASFVYFFLDLIRIPK